MRMCLTLHVKHIGGLPFFRRCKWVIQVRPIQSLESITSFLFLVAIHLWYLVFDGACSVFDHPKIFAIS